MDSGAEEMHLPVLFVMLEGVAKIPEPMMRPMLPSSEYHSNLEGILGTYINNVVENNPR